MTSTRSSKDELPRSDSDSFHDNLVRELKTSVFDKYEIVKQLGEGAMGSVSIVRIKDGKVGGTAFEHTKKGPLGILSRKHITVPNKDRPKGSHEYLYAMKTIKLDRMDSKYVDDLVNEIAILKTLDHPNIIRAYEVYYNKRKPKKTDSTTTAMKQVQSQELLFKPIELDQIYLILELCTGGDLFKRAPYSQRDAATIIVQILNAIKYMHSRNVVHRDLKFENIMFEDDTPESQIKIIDFGVSKKFFKGEPDYMTQVVGTFYSMAPQVLQGVYSSQADMWSLGVIAYMLLSTSRPFYSANNKKMIDEIMRCNPKYDGPGWDPIDEIAKDFVRKLLVVDPDQRMTAAVAMEHEWIKNMEQLSTEKPNDEILQRIDYCLAHYKDTSDLKKIALNVIAHKSTNKQIVELRKVFESFDVARDGTLSFDEFRIVLEKGNFSDEDVKEIFASVDVNQNGHIMYNEFLAATLEAQGRIEEDRVAEAFDRIDSDRSGYITKEDLIAVLNPGLTSDEAQKIITAADYDHDGKISYNEFLRNFRETRNQCCKDFAAVISTSNHVKESHNDLAGNDEKSLLGLDCKIPGGSYDEKLKKKGK